MSQAIVMERTSHREAKKQATAQAIYKAAETLFIQDGYTKTTLGSIAQAAGIAQRTIFSYFSSKEAILFYADEAIVSDLITRIEQRQQTAVFDCIRSFINDNQALLNHTPTKRDAARQALILQTPVLSEYVSALLQNLEDVLAKALADERGLAVDSLQTKLIAAVCRAAIHYEIEHKPGISADEFDIVTKFIEAGVNATRKYGHVTHK